MKFEKKGSSMSSKIYLRFLPYAMAVGSVAIALVMTFLLEPMLTLSIASLFFVAVAFTSWCGGMKPAILTTVLSALAINYFFVPPIHHFIPGSLSDAVRLGLFFLNASIINSLGSDLRRSRRKIEQLSQELLEESAKQLSLAISATQMGLWNWNIQTGEIKWSPEHEQIFGLAPGTFDGRYETFDSCLHPDDREALNWAINRAIKNQSAYQHEYRIVWADASVHWVEGRGQAFYDQTGCAVRMMGTVIDISERKQAEADLSKSEQYLRTIIDAEPECVKVITPDGILLNMNAAGLAMIEADSLEQVLGQCVCPIIAPTHQQAFIDFTQQVAQGSPGVLEFEILGLKGTHRWLESHAVSLPDPTETVSQVLSITRDITGRKQAEMALRESEQRYISLAAAVPVGIFRTDTQGDCIYVNEHWCQITGLTLDRAKTRGWIQALHPEDRERVVQEWYYAATQNYQIFNSEFRFLRTDGVVTWVLAQAVIEQAVSGEILGYVGTITNITNRKQREEQLRLLESVILTTNDAVLITEAEPIDLPRPQIVYANPAFTTMTGYTQEEVLGKNPRILQGEKSDRAALDKIRAALQTWQPVQADLINYHKDGSEYWVELSIVPVNNENGWYTHWVAVQRDITQRKQAEAELQKAKADLEIRVTERTAELSQANVQLQQELIERQEAEEALRQSEAKFRSLSECSPIGIFMSDAQGETTYTNPRAQEIGGYSFEEALGNGWLRFIHPEDRERLLTEWLATTSKQQRFSYDDLRYVHKDGTVRYARVESAPKMGADGQQFALVGTIEDITESRAIAQMKNEFISIVSHELRTPLTAIRGSLGLLAAGVYDKKPEKGKRMVQIAAEQTDRLVRLVNDILDLGRLESGKMNFETQSCDARALIQQSVDAMRSSAEQNQIELSITSPCIQIWADPDSIVQTLTNLLSNAIKFSPPNTIIWLTAQQVDNQLLEKHTQSQTPTPYVLFQVKDQGRGIPPEKIEAIFERFQQVDASDSRQKGGTGLGLAICRRIIQQHGGNIWAESVVGEGSSFYFTLPIVVE
jgi:PAS domain S-box-containing protein